MPASGDATDAASATETETAPADSATAAARGEKLANARFRVGEIYLFRLDDAESALPYYDDVITFHPGSPQAPKAALAKAWLLKNKLDRPEAAELAYTYLIDKYPGTEYAAAAREALGLPEEAPADTAGVAPPDTLESLPALVDTMGGTAAPADTAGVAPPDTLESLPALVDTMGGTTAPADTAGVAPPDTLESLPALADTMGGTTAPADSARAPEEQ